jgi:hypothetical protein
MRAFARPLRFPWFESRLAVAFIAVLTGGFLLAPRSGRAGDPLEGWRQGVKVHPVSGRLGRHTIHSYYLSNPESPDTRHVLYYASNAPEGYRGTLVMLDRATGQETELARDVNVEDAHRAACQQWVSGGRRVAFHDVRSGHWLVASIDVVTGCEEVLARDRQLGFGQPAGDWLPLYGCHWNPGRHRDLELKNVASGELRTAVTNDAVRAAHGAWLQKEFGGGATSIFFPILSPDLKRVFFKMACGSGGDNYRTDRASHREGLIGYDLEHDRFLFLRERWGHPAWHPDSRRIIEVGNLLIDSDDGAVSRIPDLPQLRGCHPSVSPDGTLLVMDGLLGPLSSKRDEWGIVVADLQGRRFAIVHRFDNAHGARSWRVNHPHPVFSVDSRRIYFNVNSGDWTQLHVAEAASQAAAP